MRRIAPRAVVEAMHRERTIKAEAEETLHIAVAA